MAEFKEINDTIRIERSSGKFRIEAKANNIADVEISGINWSDVKTFADLHSVIELLYDTEEALHSVTNMYDTVVCDECVGPCYVQ